MSSVALARARMGWSAETRGGLAGRRATCTGCCGSSRRGTGCWCCRPTRPRRSRRRAAHVARRRRERASSCSVTSARPRSRGVEGTASTWSVVASTQRRGAGAGGTCHRVVGGRPARGRLRQRRSADQAGPASRCAGAPGSPTGPAALGRRRRCAGSVGIEWMRAHPRCRAIAVEADEERATQIGFTRDTSACPHLEVLHGRAPDALGDLPDPDAIFVGGGATAPGVLPDLPRSAPARRASNAGGRRPRLRRAVHRLRPRRPAAPDPGARAGRRSGRAAAQPAGRPHEPVGRRRRDHDVRRRRLLGDRRPARRRARRRPRRSRTPSPSPTPATTSG